MSGTDGKETGRSDRSRDVFEILTLEQAIDRLVACADARRRALRTRWQDDCGRWQSEAFKNEHAWLFAVSLRARRAFPACDQEDGA